MTTQHTDLQVGDRRFWSARRTWIAVFALVIAVIIALWFIVAAAGDGGEANDTHALATATTALGLGAAA